MANGVATSAAFRGRKNPKILRAIEVSRDAHGGYTMKHHMDSYEHPPEVHQVKTGAQMVAHLKKHMGCDGD